MTMILRWRCKDNVNGYSINRNVNGGVGVEDALYLRSKKRSFQGVILGGLLVCYSITAINIFKTNNKSFLPGETFLSVLAIGHNWKLSADIPTIGKLNQTVLLYIDYGLSKGDEKDAITSVQSLVDQFGSQSLQWEVIRSGGNQNRRKLPCVWITKEQVEEALPTDPIQANILSRCLRMVPLETASTSGKSSKRSVDWSLWKGSVDSIKSGQFNSKSDINGMDDTCTNCCLALQIGPRPGFWQRGINFERVGLWMQSASIRSYVWNLALLSEPKSTAGSAESWILDAIHVLSIAKARQGYHSERSAVESKYLIDGRNSSSLVVSKPANDYKAVPYFRDLLTSVFTFLLWEPEPALSSSRQHPSPPSKKQRLSLKKNTPSPQLTATFWKQLQEVILTGSIPIVIMVDSIDTISNKQTQFDCNHEWLLKSTSPILVVSNEKGQLQSFVKNLWEESPAHWNARQIELREWYQHIMINRAMRVEDWILESVPKSKAASPELRHQWAKEYWQALVPNVLQQRKYSQKPLCLTIPFYGRTNNRVIIIGKLLKSSYQEGKNRALALDRQWSNWYRLHFDERPDILLDYFPHGECEQTYSAREAFEIPDWDLSYLLHLLPRHDYRERAESILSTWQHGQNYISVHRRNLEGSCHVHARCSNVKLETSTCVQQRDPTEVCSVELRLHACDMEYDMVPNPEGLPIVLFTDGQVPSKDATFPQRFNTTDFFVEMWLMVKSNTHWGNPRSTVDAVVASWRQGNGMQPQECYPSS